MSYNYTCIIIHNLIVSTVTRLIVQTIHTDRVNAQPYIFVKRCIIIYAYTCLILLRAYVIIVHIPSGQAFFIYL